jgi:hypothetical protein
MRFRLMAPVHRTVCGSNAPIAERTSPLPLTQLDFGCSLEHRSAAVNPRPCCGPRADRGWRQQDFRSLEPSIRPLKHSLSKSDGGRFGSVLVCPCLCCSPVCLSLFRRETQSRQRRRGHVVVGGRQLDHAPRPPIVASSPTPVRRLRTAPSAPIRLNPASRLE